MSDAFQPAPTGLPAATTTLPALLALLPTGVVYYTPVYDAAGQVIDFRFAYLNAAAQRLLAMPAQPTATYLEQWPGSATTGTFAFHREAFLAGQPAEREEHYQADGYDVYLRVQACRLEEGLLVSLTNAADWPRTSVEKALREQQVRETNARLQVEAALHQAHEQGELLARTLGQVPAAVATLRGPEHRFAYLNDLYLTLTAGRAAVGRTVAEALPEVVSQGFIDLLDKVYTTGQPYLGAETYIQLQDAATGQLVQRYLNFTYQPLFEAQGQVGSILVFAVDVTAQVLAHHQVQALNEELAALNEELRAGNEEYLVTNTALVDSQYQQQALNQELNAFNQDLEARVAARTQEAQQQRGRLEQLVRTAPIAICVFDGPDWVYQLVNPRYQQMFPGRELLGRRLVDALPEVADQPLMDILHAVYDTGIPFESREVLVPLARTADGPVEDIYFDLTYQARYDEQGRIDGFITFATDVTAQVLARRQVEAQERETNFLNEELQAANEEIRANNDELTHTQHALRVLNEELETRVQLRTLEVQQAQQATEYQRGLLQRVLEQAPVAIAIMKEASHRITFANARMAAIWGRPVAQVLGQPHFEVLPDMAGQGLETVFAGVFETGQPATLTEQLTYLDSAGTGQLMPHYLHMVFEPLRDEWGHITGLIASSTDVTEMVLTHHQVEAQERRATLLNEELQAANEEILTNNDELARTQAELRELNEELETRIQTRTQELAASNAELQAANKELHGSNQQLTRTNADLDNFIYTASHDLKAPISNIEGLLRLLEDMLPAELSTEDGVQPVLARMQEAVERFTRTIGHLTDVSKLQLEFAHPAAPTPLAPLLDGMRQDLAPLLAETGGQLEVDVSECPTLLISEKNLRSVLYNLVSNALKYHHPDRPPVVRISCRPEAGRRVLRVQDNGLGLSAWQQAKLFQLFGRLHTHVEGTGVGLYMAKKMVENANGTLTVESREGEGSTFTASFPN